jgi:hypothetical protein
LNANTLFIVASVVADTNITANAATTASLVYEAHKTIGIAIHNRWKLQAIDSMQISQLANRMPTEERQKLINTLVGDCDKIRDILLCHCEAEKMIIC